MKKGEGYIKNWQKRRSMGHKGQCWNFRTIYGGLEPRRNSVAVSARQAT
jgi:hypothetical protein